MTVYNAGTFLETSIRSILGQTFAGFEFLIVDDCSTDGSAELAESSASKDPRIKVIRNTHNRGQTECLNLGLGLARGRWIARHDADDLAHPDRLALQYQSAQKTPEIVLLGTNGRIINERNRLVGLLDAPLSHDGITWTAPFLNPFMTDERDGLLASAGDVEDFSKQLKRLEDSPELGRYLAANARSNAVEQFSASVTARRIEDIYRRELGIANAKLADKSSES